MRTHLAHDPRDEDCQDLVRRQVQPTVNQDVSQYLRHPSFQSLADYVLTKRIVTLRQMNQK